VDVRPRAEERPLLEDVTKQRSEDLDREHQPLRDSDLSIVATSFVLKCSINPITNLNPVYRHTYHVTISVYIYIYVYIYVYTTIHCSLRKD
jgi:hypothetical protein